jgi:hypothetical protein
MMRSLRDVRLVPVVLVAAGALFVLKFTGLVTEGSYTLGAGHRAKADRIAYEAQLARDKSVASKVAASNPLSGAEAIKQAWSKETLNYQDVTGSVGATKPAETRKTATRKKLQNRSSQRRCRTALSFRSSRSRSRPPSARCSNA